MNQLELGRENAAAAILIDERLIWKGCLRVFVERLHVRMRGSAIQVVIIFFHVLPVIAFAVGQTEEPLFQNGVSVIPQRQCETEALMIVGNTQQAILSPTVGAGASMVVRQIIPGRAMLAVIFTDGSPLSLAQVRTPASPVRRTFARLLQSLFFRRHVSLLGVTIMKLPPVLPFRILAKIRQRSRQRHKRL